MPCPIRVSPRHHIALSDDYEHMIVRAPREDFVVRTLARRTAGKMTLMLGELVIAGAGTRERYARAKEYPLHFRKTYYPGKMHGDPRNEFEFQERAGSIIDLPQPIGCTPNTFRSCFLPGTPLDQLSRLAAEPAVSNIALAQQLPLAAVAGLWRLAEEAFRLMKKLESGGIAHGDAHLHNFIVCPSPLEVLPIDFENAVLKDAVAPAIWEQRTHADLMHVFRLAVYLQCALGQQQGPLADAAMASLADLVQPAEQFRRVIKERTFDDALT